MGFDSRANSARQEETFRPKAADTRGSEPGQEKGLDAFAAWIEDLMRARGYDIDSPRGGGRSKLADDAGVHRAAVSRLLGRQSMPDLDTMRRLALVLRVPLRDLLIRSGKLAESDLPIAADYAGAGDRDDHRLTPEEAARRMGIPPERQEMFVRVARQFLPDDLTEEVRRGGPRRS